MGTLVRVLCVILAQVYHSPDLFIVYLTWRVSSSVAALTRVLRRASGETPAESLLHEIASWWLFGCGILYSVAVSAILVS